MPEKTIERRTEAVARELADDEGPISTVAELVDRAAACHPSFARPRGGRSEEKEIARMRTYVLKKRRQFSSADSWSSERVITVVAVCLLLVLAWIVVW
jgi:hypothetical protein